MLSLVWETSFIFFYHKLAGQSLHGSCHNLHFPVPENKNNYCVHFMYVYVHIITFNRNWFWLKNNRRGKCWMKLKENKISELSVQLRFPAAAPASCCGDKMERQAVQPHFRLDASPSMARSQAQIVAHPPTHPATHPPLELIAQTEGERTS